PSRYTSERCTVYAHAAHLVRPRQPRPAVAPRPRSVSRARLRIHAAADPGDPGGAVLSAVSRAVSGSGDAGACEAARGTRGVGWVGVLCAGEEFACARETRRTTAR